MKRLLLLMSLVLVSCTGTPEDEPPVFVITGVQNGTTAQLALFEDAYKTANDSTPRFKSFTTVRLEAPAIAFDIVDRMNTRSELVVLTREEDGTSFLEFFGLLGIEEAADFTEITSKQLELSTLTDLPATVELCPTSIQVTRDGSLAAINNNPEVCGGPDDEIGILIIDIKNKKYLNQISEIGVFPLSPLPATLDQGNDALFFLSTTGGSGVRLNRLDRNNFSSSNNSCNILICYTGTIQSNTSQTDFIKRNSDVLVLNRSQYTYTTISGNNLETLNVPTISQGQSFIHDPTNQYSQVFVLSNTRIAIHQDPDTTTLPNRIEGSTSSRLGTINTFTDFLYLVADNTLQVYDLLELANSPNSISLETETANGINRNPDLSILNNPSIVTWVQGVITAIP